MEESHRYVQPKFSSKRIINESENKSGEDLLENYEIKNVIESINKFNSEHSKGQKRKESNRNILYV